jgi:hypothetical protein
MEVGDSPRTRVGKRTTGAEGVLSAPVAEPLSRVRAIRRGAASTPWCRNR